MITGPTGPTRKWRSRLIDTLKPFGITVLRNEIHDVDGLQIAGLDDWWARHFDAQSVLPRIDKAPGRSRVEPQSRHAGSAGLGTTTRAGFFPGTRTADSASRHFCRHRSCRSATDATRRASSRCRGTAASTSIGVSDTCCTSDSTFDRKSPCSSSLRSNMPRADERSTPMHRREFVRLAGSGMTAGALAEAVVSAQATANPGARQPPVGFVGARADEGRYTAR